MAKTVGVWLCNADLELLHSLGKALNVTEESRVMKIALKHLGTEHVQSRPAPQPQGPSNLAVVVPAEVRLTSIVKQSFEEVQKEKAIAEEAQKRKLEEEKKDKERLELWRQAIFGG